MRYFFYPLSALLMIALPGGLAIWLTRRTCRSLPAPWRIFWIGAATFVLSQVVHLPLNAGLTALFRQGLLPAPSPAIRPLFNAVLLGLSAGLCEELARYLALRYWLKEARSWRAAPMFGAGHGGIEAMILGALSLLAFIQLAALRGADLSVVVKPEQLVATRAQVVAYWAAPWAFSLLAPLERVFALISHLTLATLVMQVFLRGRLRWLWAAVGWHALLDAAGVYAMMTAGAYAAEAVIGALALPGMGMLLYFRQPEPAAEPQEALPPAARPLPPFTVQVTPERLDDTRYSG